MRNLGDYQISAYLP